MESDIALKCTNHPLLQYFSLSKFYSLSTSNLLYNKEFTTQMIIVFLSY